MFAACFNFLALWVFHLHVAATIGKGTVDPQFVDYYVIFGALCGAIIWNVATWFYGIPSSSSHALIGSLVGGVRRTRNVRWGGRSTWWSPGYSPSPPVG